MEILEIGAGSDGGGSNWDDAVIVALGSNLSGDFPSSEALLETALARLDQAGLPVLRRSRWWRSAAWPDPSGPEYRNGVAIVEAPPEPRSVLDTLFSIEAEFNRKRAVRNAPRTLDLDLIAHGRTILHDEALRLPHPRAHERLFVMGPLAEIAPDWRHPLLGLEARKLAAAACVGRDAAPG